MKKAMCLAAAISGLVLGGCSTAPTSSDDRSLLHSEVDSTYQRMSSEDPGFAPLLDHASGYAIFPAVGKGAAGIGGSYGRGELYQDGHFAGYADITQATLGVQLGGQSFSEALVFENSDSVDRFKAGQVAFDANASAVALKSGAAATARYNHGVAAFVEPTGGLMFEAAIGGQSFSFQPDNIAVSPPAVARTDQE
jgi:lipid-binding SYLF domain-containing protein